MQSNFASISGTHFDGFSSILESFFMDFGRWNRVDIGPQTLAVSLRRSASKISEKTKKRRSIEHRNASNQCAGAVFQHVQVLQPIGWMLWSGIENLSENHLKILEKMVRNRTENRCKMGWRTNAFKSTQKPPKRVQKGGQNGAKNDQKPEKRGSRKRVKNRRAKKPAEGGKGTDLRPKPPPILGHGDD